MLDSLPLRIPVRDKEFDEIYPPEIRKLSERHFTSFKVSQKISKWLNEYREPLEIVDLGCGVGKFCFAMSSLTKHKVTGVDFRKNYIDLCNRISFRYGFKNLSFMHKDIMELDFSHFNVFYFFNSFLEQLDKTARLDEQFETSPMIYTIYRTQLKSQLFKMPSGTIFITYHLMSNQVPENYSLVKTDFDGLLKMWIRI